MNIETVTVRNQGRPGERRGSMMRLHCCLKGSKKLSGFRLPHLLPWRTEETLPFKSSFPFSFQLSCFFFHKLPHFIFFPLKTLPPPPSFLTWLHTLCPFIVAPFLCTLSTLFLYRWDISSAANVIHWICLFGQQRLCQSTGTVARTWTETRSNSAWTNHFGKRVQCVAVPSFCSFSYSRTHGKG